MVPAVLRRTAKSWPATLAAKVPGTGKLLDPQDDVLLCTLEVSHRQLAARCPLYGFVTKYSPSFVQQELDNLQADVQD